MTTSDNSSTGLGSQSRRSGARVTANLACAMLVGDGLKGTVDAQEFLHAFHREARPRPSSRRTRERPRTCTISSLGISWSPVCRRLGSMKCPVKKLHLFVGALLSWGKKTHFFVRSRATAGRSARAGTASGKHLILMAVPVFLIYYYKHWMSDEDGVAQKPDTLAEHVDGKSVWVFWRYGTAGFLEWILSNAHLELGLLSGSMETSFLSRVMCGVLRDGLGRTNVTCLQGVELIFPRPKRKHQWS